MYVYDFVKIPNEENKIAMKSIYFCMTAVSVFFYFPTSQSYVLQYDNPNRPGEGRGAYKMCSWLFIYSTVPKKRGEK